MTMLIRKKITENDDDEDDDDDEVKDLSKITMVTLIFTIKFKRSLDIKYYRRIT